MRRVVLLVLALLSLQAQAFELKPFSASYTADWQQMPINGSASRSLTHDADGRWTLHFEASMLVASLVEESTFRLDKGTFLPVRYQYKRGGLGKGKETILDFDWNEKQVLGTDRDDQVRFDLNRGLLDKSTYQVALQSDVADGKQSMSYQVIDGDDIETYDFRVLGEESVRTRAGLVDAVKVERVRDPTQSRRRTVLWFAKDWDYLLVALNQVETDGKQYQIILEDGEVDGRKVVGRPN